MGAYHEGFWVSYSSVTVLFLIKILEVFRVLFFPLLHEYLGFFVIVVIIIIVVVVIVLVVFLINPVSSVINDSCSVVDVVIVLVVFFINPVS